jgi:tetratricopeptide (TPR) repeat protein
LARYGDASEDLTSAQALARATGDLDREAAAMEELAWCAYHARQMDRAGALADRAAEHVAAGLGPRVLIGRLQNTRGDLAGAIDSLESLSSSEDAAVASRALSYLGTALAQSDRFAEATAVLERSAATCRAAGLLRPMFNSTYFAGIVRASVGDLAGALELTTQMLVDVDRFALEVFRPRAHNLLSWLWRELGEPSRALDHAHQALETSRLPDGVLEAEPAAHARLQLAESALQLGDDAGAAAWLADLREHALDPVAFGWRIDLHRLDVQARMDPFCADELLERAGERGSAKYRSLALAHLGRHDEAHMVAAGIGAELLIAHVATGAPAAAAIDRLAARLPPELREGFVHRGACSTRSR